jgi:hypothetical protein
VSETECNGWFAHRGSDWEPAEGESHKDVGLEIRPGMPSGGCFITYSEGYAFRNLLGVPAHVCVGMRGRCQAVHGVSPLTVPPGRIADMELPLRSRWF